MKKYSLMILLAALWLGASLVGATFYTVAEGQQALIVRLGAPQGIESKPGLKIKVPFIDNAIVFDTRLLLLAPPVEQVILGDQKRLEVKTYARFRIVDPLVFYQSLHTLDQANARVAQLVGSSIRRELGQVSLVTLLSDAREKVVARVRDEVAQESRQLGIEVTEIRIHRADLPPETSQAIYDRMKSERQREAKELRAQGFEWAQQIQAQADHDRTVVLSQAQRDATITRGQGEGEANQILAQAFDRDAKFYGYYRTLQTYRQSLAASSPTIVVSPDTDFLRVLKAGPDAGMTGGVGESKAPQ